MQGTRTGAYIAAGLLSALTLAVFAILRDFGPESALRRFHVGTFENNDREIQRVTLQDVDHPSVVELKRRLRQLRNMGARIQVGGVLYEDRVQTENGKQVTVHSSVHEVHYFTSRGVYDFFWVLDLRPEGWVVNAQETLNFPYKRFGVGRPG